MVPASFAPFAFAGEGFALGRCGALWWPRQAALVVADLHLEKASWFAGSGQMLPPYDSHATLAKLAAAVAGTGATRVFCLGDSFHDAGGPARLELEAARLLDSLMRRAQFVWIAGNHDHDVGPAGAAVAEALEVSGVRLVHAARPGASGPEMSGHFHPKLAISHAGRRIARPCAVRSANRLVLPAYGALTGGLHAESPAIRAALAPDQALEALLVAGGRLVAWPLTPGAAAPLRGAA